MRKLTLLFTLFILLLLSSCQGCSAPQQTLHIPGMSNVEQTLSEAWIYIDLGLGSGSGNGIAIAENEQGSIILTAAHVCIQGFPRGADIYGRQFTFTLLDIDPVNDLCLMQANRHTHSFINSIELDPVLRSSVVNVCTPSGLYRSYPDHSLFTNYGEFMGASPISLYEAFLYVDLETARGCSGSGVIDSQGNLIGIVSRRVSNWERGTLLASGKSISAFLFRNSVYFTTHQATINQSDYFETLGDTQ